MGVQAMKHAVKLQEWSERIAECRSSGQTVKAWCAQHGIAIKTYYYWEKRFAAEATRQMSLPIPGQGGQLIRINPDTMSDGDPVVNVSGLSIHHGESIISLPVGNSEETIAELVKALNCHA